MRPSGRAVAGVAVGIGVLPFATPPTPASAQAGFHNFATATLNFYNFDGFAITRFDNPANVGCEYQSMWAHNDASHKFLELGTGHFCNLPGGGGGAHFHYWGWADFSSGLEWHTVGTEAADAFAQHSFKIIKGNGFFNYYVDTTKKDSLSLANYDAANRLEVGFESYNNALAGYSYANTALKYRLIGGSFTDWGASTPGVGANMCGSYNGWTTWNSGEGMAC